MVYFRTKNPHLGKFLEGLSMDDVCIFLGHLVYFTACWFTLWTFGIFFGNLVHFSPFWYVVPRKIWQPCLLRLYLLKTFFFSVWIFFCAKMRISEFLKGSRSPAPIFKKRFRVHFGHFFVDSSTDFFNNWAISPHRFLWLSLYHS
jgi:hypothetical protein